MSGAVVMDSGDDFLQRSGFLLALEHHIDDLAQIPLSELPAPRVLAVDARWGYGKTWVAERLLARLKSEPEGRPVAFVDAFRHDHHDDVFAVIAAAVLAALTPKGAKRKKFIAAAGSVLQSTAPALLKAGMGLALKAVNLDPSDISDAVTDVVDAAAEGAGKVTEKAVERLFEAYSKTRELQEGFQKSLGDITKDLPHPFVVIVDELDRCRPSFALEVLERIKHLFSAEKVVFVLFWNSESIHESIRHTYGMGTDAEAYLSKFVSLSIPLTLPFRKDLGLSSRYSSFIERELTRTVRIATNSGDFQQALAAYAGVFNASLRDVQKAISTYRLAVLAEADFPQELFAYLALLRVTNEVGFRRLLGGDARTSAEEAGRFPAPSAGKRVGPLEEIWMHLTYRSDPGKYVHLAGMGIKGEVETNDLLIDYLQVNSGPRYARTGWFDHTCQLIEGLLTATPGTRSGRK